MKSAENKDINGDSMVTTGHIDKHKNEKNSKYIDDDKSETHLLVIYSIVRTQSCREDEIMTLKKHSCRYNQQAETL